MSSEVLPVADVTVFSIFYLKLVKEILKGKKKDNVNKM